MAKRRPPKESDQVNIEYAYQIVIKTIEDHPEVETTLWAGALLSALANAYIDAGLSYEQFESEFDSAKKFYRKWWDE